MADQESPAKSPSESLAGIIAALLTDKGLTLKSDAARITGKIAAGKAKAEDWRLVVEKALDREETADE